MSQDKNQLILDVKNLVVRYETEDGVVHALNGIDLQLGYRQTIGLVGETGAGKTTAARQRISLKGEITSPVNLPDECRFANRCFECNEFCRKGIPQLKEVSPNHFVACFTHG